MLLKNIEANKLRISRYYDQEVRVKQFSKGDLVWKVKSPIKSGNSRFDERLANWEGPYWIKCYAPGNTCILGTKKKKTFRQSNQMGNI